MEKFNVYQIEQFLNLEREVLSSADHMEVANRGNFWGDHEDDTISSMTITTSMTSGRIKF